MLDIGKPQDAPTVHPNQAGSALLNDSLDFDLAGLTLPEEPAHPGIIHAHNEDDVDLNSLNFDMPASMTDPVPAGDVHDAEFHKTAEVKHQAALPASAEVLLADTGLDFMHEPAPSQGPLHTEPKAEPVSKISEPAVTRPDPLEFDLSGISLDLSPTGAAAPHTPSNAPSHHVSSEHDVSDTLVLDDESMSSAPEMATKLDLAMAYEEIGDKEGARELLDEVINGGSADQIAKAKEMLSKLG